MTGRRIAAGMALAGGGLVAAVTLLGVSGLEPLKLNTTASLPKGLYVRSFETPRVGTIVWFPLPAALQAYVADVPGAAQWFARPGNGLLKPVVGRAGDIICRGADRTFSVNGRALAQVPATGPGGRPLLAWQGCRKLQEGELAVFALLLPDSLDSRLYGPIAAATARVYRPLWTVAP